MVDYVMTRGIQSEIVLLFAHDYLSLADAAAPKTCMQEIDMNQMGLKPRNQRSIASSGPVPVRMWLNWTIKNCMFA